MKLRFILILSLALGAAITARLAAANYFIPWSSGGGGPASYTLLYDCITSVAAGTTRNCGESTTNYYNGPVVTDTVSRAIGKITIRVSSVVGDVSGKSYVCRIWNQSSGNLTTVQATSAAVAGNNSWSDTAVDFVFSPAVTVGATWAFAIDPNNATADGSNYIRTSWIFSGACVSPFPSSSSGFTVWNSTGGGVDGGGATNKMVSNIYTSP